MSDRGYRLVAAGLFACVCPLAFTGKPAQAQCSFAWKSGEGVYPDPYSMVLAATVYDDGSGPALYLAGSCAFSLAGGEYAYCIAKWDGTSWSALGSGIDEPLGWVNALTVYNHELIVGGTFTTAGGVSANHIAKWNGSSWSPLSTAAGNGVNGDVCALTAYNGDLIAGGFFSTAGGVSAYNIARWNGNSWSAMDAGANSGIGGYVYALTEYNDELVVGGNFYNAGDLVPRNIVKWKDGTWSLLGTGSSNGVDNCVYALAVYKNELVAGGDFNHASGTISVRGLAKWNATSWSAVGSGATNGVGGIVRALTVFDGQLIVGGSLMQAGSLPVNRIAAWDGSSWSALGTGISTDPLVPIPVSGVRALISFHHDLIAAGWFTGAGDQVSYGWARWGAVGPFVAADFDQNCRVDVDDLTAFDACVTGPALPYVPGIWPAGCTLTADGDGRIAADFDRDGDVDQADFGIFQRCFSGSSPVSYLDCAD